MIGVWYMNMCDWGTRKRSVMEWFRDQRWCRIYIGLLQAFQGLSGGGVDLDWAFNWRGQTSSTSFIPWNQCESAVKSETTTRLPSLVFGVLYFVFCQSGLGQRVKSRWGYGRVLKEVRQHQRFHLRDGSMGRDNGLKGPATRCHVHQSLWGFALIGKAGPMQQEIHAGRALELEGEGEGEGNRRSPGGAKVRQSANLWPLTGWLFGPESGFWTGLKTGLLWDAGKK